MNDRRQSVAPSTSYRYRSRSMATDCDENHRGQQDGRMFPSALRTASFATSHIRRMTKMFSIDKTKEVLRVALEDRDRVEYIRLACEHDELAKEMKQLKGFLGELCERYDAARSLDPLRRYKRMQSMAKTIVLQLRVNDHSSATSSALLMCDSGNGACDSINPSAGGLIVGDVLQSSVKQKEMRLKHDKISRTLSTEELQRDIKKLQEENEQLKSRIDEITDAIDNIDVMYNATKSEPFMKRYATLKEVIKEAQKLVDGNANFT